LGWGATPSGALPFWYPTAIDVDPVSGRTALTVRGNDDSVTNSCAPQSGEAQLVLHDGTRFIAYAAGVGGQFGAAAELQTGSAGKPSVAIGCNGDALAAWNRGSSGIFAAVNLTGAAQCEGSGPGGEEPGPDPTPTPTPPASGGGQSTPPPAPPAVVPTDPKAPVLRCKKGFQKKTVHGKAKCVKKPKKGKKKH
jgi:hypothetical protein